MKIPDSLYVEISGFCHGVAKVFFLQGRQASARLLVRYYQPAPCNTNLEKPFTVFHF
jgi:hypothetical protein